MNRFPLFLPRQGMALGTSHYHLPRNWLVRLQGVQILTAGDREEEALLGT